MDQDEHTDGEHTDDGEATSYFTDPAITPADVAELFEVASALWKAAPWQHVSAEAMLHVGVEARGLEDAALSVLGDGKRVFGLMLYDSMEDYDAVLDELGDLDELHEEGDEVHEQASPDARVTSFIFETADQLPEGMREEAEKHGWPLPAPGLYPSLARIAEGAPAPVTRDDFQLLLALARALTEFASKHKDALERYGELPVRETYVDREGLETVLTVPHPEVDLEDLQEAPRAQTLPGVENPYGLPLSRKELQQLDRALGNFTIHRLVGMFCAVVSVPELLTPKRWMALIAPSVKVADAVDFRVVSDAMMRAYNHVVERMQAWSIAELVPVSEAPEACRAWARGYTSICDEVELAEQKGEIVDSLFGLYVSGEVPRYLTILDGDLRDATREERIREYRELLADDVAYLYEGWERARREYAERALAKPVPIKAELKPGRNDPCSCGSGKKFKKCCG